MIDLAPCPVTGKPCGCFDWCDKLPPKEAQAQLVRVVLAEPEKRKEPTP